MHSWKRADSYRHAKPRASHQDQRAVSSGHKNIQTPGPISQPQPTILFDRSIYIGKLQAADPITSKDELTEIEITVFHGT
jgi:hypothetical protein